jgi:hypothetical protein
MNGLVSTLTLEKPKLLDWPACYMIYYTASSVMQIQWPRFGHGEDSNCYH